MIAPRTSRVARFAHDLVWDELPADVQRQSERCAVDLFAVAIAGTVTEVAQIVTAYVLDTYGAGAATLIAGGTCSPAGAALANGFAASALDMDDGYRPVKGHPGAVIFPAILAAAEERCASGREFLTALVAGYEVAMRAGHVLHPLYGFYHGTGSWGPMGAAAGAARLLGGDADQIGGAMGIAEFHAPTTPEMRSVDRPSMLKDGIGWGAHVGLVSAQLAMRGFTGIPSLFDTDVAAGATAESLGSRYLIRDLYFKPYACCRWAHPAVDSALVAQNDLGVTAADIAGIRVHTFEAASHLRAAAPRTTEEAQFSLPWPVACALIHGEVGPDQVGALSLSDPDTRMLADRVQTIHDPDLETRFPEHALAWVEIETRDGRVARSEVMAARGDAGAPLTDEEIVEKFLGLTRPILGSSLAGKLLFAIQALSTDGDLQAVTGLLDCARQSRDIAREATKPGRAGRAAVDRIGESELSSSSRGTKGGPGGHISGETMS
ncbi:MAG: MmgE/PrpD family protein [Chloroflexota bacterium]